MEKEQILQIIREAKESQIYPEDMFDFSSSEYLPEEKRDIMMKINHLRINVLTIIGIDEKDKVLLIGEDGDIVSEYLRAKAATVDFETDFDEYQNKLENEGKYTKIISLGTFPTFASGRYEKALKALRKSLTEEGKLVLAIPNQFGLKYFRGNREEYSKGYFIGIEGFKDYDTRTFSRKKIKKLIKNAGFEKSEFYFPYPDYRYATDIFSAEHMPKKGELSDHFEGSEMQHLMLFDETGAWDEIIEAGLFKEFANSFLIIAEKNETKAKKEKEKILYARFSNDRAKDKGIRTLVTVDSDSNPHVYKLSDSMFSDCHIKCIENTYKMLNDTYSEKMTKEDEYGGQFPKISANDYSNANDKSWELTRGRNEVIELDFVDGKTLEDLLDKNLSDGKIERFFELAKKYAAVINSARDLKKFEMTPEFKKVFGDIKSEVLQTLDATSVADIDMIPANIVVSGNEWLILDYEWTFTFPVPTNYIIYRGLHYYLASDAVGRQDVPDDIYEKLGISDEEIEVYKKMEEGFQHYVVGEHKPLSTTALMMVNKPSLHIDNMVLHTEAQVMRQYHSVVFDYGEGFDKKDEKPVENAGIYKDLKVDIPIEADYCGRTAKNLKFNLWNYDSSLIEIEELAIMTADGRELDMREKILTSAYKVDESVYYFDHGSPCIYLMDIPSDAKRFVATVKIIETDETIKQALVPKILWKRGLKKAILGKNK